MSTLQHCEQLKTSECTEQAWLDLRSRMQDQGQTASLGGRHQILTDMQLISDRLTSAPITQKAASPT